MFLDHTQRRSTVGRTPLDEWSARRRDLYLTTHDTHNRQISMPPVGFEAMISAGEWPQAAHLLRSWVRIPPGAWIFVCCECRVLGRGLCDELITRPEEFYRLCCIVVCDLETSRMGAPYINDISHLRVKRRPVTGGTIFIWSVVKGDDVFKNVEWLCTHARHRAWRSLPCEFVLKKKHLNELREQRFIYNLPKPRTC